ncbi:diacylglycerol/lipid kinase family protein [Vineibacter terrae]|uniref:diacylglycerol/lipid kinase family protein n=1 Tax=Vineibacter terrae TaxID=2586908 RepID=UPI002E32E422|nr:diacylglycerol kinase family protein [Vineibacter terrae]HEX2888637.1 diacylglycerol kinase family protein [Vineibacter terrae]
MSFAPSTPPVGVLINRKSGRNRANLTDLRNLIVQSPDVVARETLGQAEAVEALREFADLGVEVLAIAGGDGTLQHVFSLMLNERIFQKMPLLAVLPGGTTNMIGYDIGVARKPAKELAAVLARVRAGRLNEGRVPRRLIAVHRPNKNRPAYGLFGGGAGVHQGTMISRRSVNRLGMRDAAGPLAGLISLAGPLLLGRNPIKPVSAGITHDAVAEPHRDYIAIAVTTMERLILGLSPFWGSGPGPIRLTTVTAKPRRFSRVLLPLLSGRTTPDSTPANGYRSVNAAHIEIDMTGGFVLDGEMFDLEAGRPLRLDAGPEITFVRGADNGG